MKGKIALACFLTILAVIVALNVNRLGSTPPGTDPDPSGSSHAGNSNMTNSVSLTRVHGIVGYHCYSDSNKNSAYTISFNDYTTALTYEQGAGSNFYYTYLTTVPSGVTYSVTISNATHVWVPEQRLVTPTGSSYEEDFYCSDLIG